MSKIKSQPKFPRNEVLDRQVEQYVKTRSGIRAGGTPGAGQGKPRGGPYSEPMIQPLYGVVISTDP
jgi:hypothetical protein